MLTKAPPAGPIRSTADSERLQAMYLAAERRIEQMIRIAALRSNRGTETYYRLQLLQVQAILAKLNTQAQLVARAAIETAYLSGVAAVDHHARTVLPSFTGVDESAIRQITHALAAPLQRVSQTVGRQTLDAYRQVGLHQSGLAIVTGRPMRETAQGIADHLARQGITGFVDRAGRRWKMSTYTRMVARTTVREAVTQGTKDRMSVHGLDLVTVSEHDNSCEICAPFEGETYSLSGNDPEYDELPDGGPPWHPQCEHVISPAEADWQRFVASLDGVDLGD